VQTRPSSCGNQIVLSFDLVWSRFAFKNTFVVEFDRVIRSEACFGVDVVNPKLAHLGRIAKVDCFDVSLDIVAESHPIMFGGHLARRGLPAQIARCFIVLLGLRSDVHELLRNAANVDACTAEAPCGASRWAR